MEKEFVTYEIALALKELGFDEECFTYFKNGIIDLDDEGILEIYKNYDAHNDIDEYISSPLWQQAFDWFRDVMLLDNFIIPYWFIDGEYKVKKYTYSIEPSNRFDEYFDCDSDQYETYEEARQACLEKLIEIAKEQNVK